MQNILTTMFRDLPIKFLVHLDDILLMGPKDILNKAKLILLASLFLFNEDKCTFQPTRQITYLGVNIDLDTETLSLSTKFVKKIMKELIKVKNYFLINHKIQTATGWADELCGSCPTASDTNGELSLSSPSEVVQIC